MSKAPLTISSYTLGTKVLFEDRVRIAKEAGYEGIGLRAENYIAALAEGYTDEELLEILEKYDITVTEVEYITMWGSAADRTEAQQMKEQVIYHMANLFNVGHINCGLMEKLPMANMIEAFKGLCDRAKAKGNLIIGLEFMPYSGVPDLKTAWEIVDGAGCDNGMLILDTWHWARANQEFDMIQQIPAEKVISIQICDVLERPYAEEISRDESLHDRLAPGTGFGDTAGFTKMIKDYGINPKVIGVEVISDINVAQGVAYAAQHTFDAAVKVLEQVWPEMLPQK